MSDVVFLKVDVDENEDLASKYDVSAMPTFLFIKNKEKVRLTAATAYHFLSDFASSLWFYSRLTAFAGPMSKNLNQPSAS